MALLCQVLRRCRARRPRPVPYRRQAPDRLRSPGTLQTIVGASTIEVNDGNTFAAIFDRGQGGGISKLYDLATDPGRTHNLGPQPGYTVFNSYLLDNQVYAPSTKLGVWGLIGGGQATTFQVLSSSPESVTIHAVAPYLCETVDAPGGTCFLGDVNNETWTTLYPGGYVFFERRIITGSTAHAGQLGSLVGGHVPVRHPERHLRWGHLEHQLPEPGRRPRGHRQGEVVRPVPEWQRPGQRLGVLEITYQDNSLTPSRPFSDMRLIMGTAYLRSHVTARTERTSTLTANTTYVARYRGWLSTLVNISNANAMTADYRSPSLSVSAGSIASTDSELGASLVSGYNAGTGRYVVSPNGAGTVQAQLGFPAGVNVRFRPSFKVVGWSAGAHLSCAGAASPWLPERIIYPASTGLEPCGSASCSTSHRAMRARASARTRH